MRHEDWCFLCELQCHIHRANGSLHPFAPTNILSHLPNIGGNLGFGRQEDAHEFMRWITSILCLVYVDGSLLDLS